MRSFVRDSAGGLVPMMDAGAADVPARIGIARKSTAQRVNGIVVNSEQSILIKERLPVGIGSLEAAAVNLKLDPCRELCSLSVGAGTLSDLSEARVSNGAAGDGKERVVCDVVPFGPEVQLSGLSNVQREAA